MKRRTAMFRRIEVSPGAVVLLSLLFYLNPRQICLPFVLAAACHEAGHLIVAKLLGGTVRRVQICAAGAVIYASFPTYGGEFLALLAGPLTNLLLGTLFLHKWFDFALINLGLATFNLLPARSLDGGRLLFLLLLSLMLPDRADRAVQAVSALLCLGFLAGGIYAAIYLQWGLWICIVGVMLAGRLNRKNALAK